MSPPLPVAIGGGVAVAAAWRRSRAALASCAVTGIVACCGRLGRCDEVGWALSGSSPSGGGATARPTTRPRGAGGGGGARRHVAGDRAPAGREPTRTRPTAPAGPACTRPRRRATSRSPGRSSRPAPTRTCARGRGGRRLDVAERSGRLELAGLLRQYGAKGSGKSIGDTVCVRPWHGDGYCAVVEAADPTRYRLRVSRIVGCAAGCEPEPSCSGGRVVGAGRTRRGRGLWVPASCLTHTGVR